MRKICPDKSQSKPGRNCKRANGRAIAACKETLRNSFLLGLFLNLNNGGNTVHQNAEVPQATWHYGPDHKVHSLSD
jgi:hypothetical protein